jgi:hypothetical protein
VEEVDLGCGHWLRFTSWSPDRQLNPHFAGIPDVEKYGGIVRHATLPSDTSASCLETGWCEGAVTFAGEAQRKLSPAATTWDVLSGEPLTLSPSLLCHCGDHGYIRDGRWVPA